MEIKNELPKKSPLSMQMDLSKFELATADEKRQQDRMRESTTFFKDGIRKLKKDKISIACLVILAIIMIIAFVVPSFYPYDYATTSAGKNSITTNYLAPFQYSPAEQAIIDSGGHVFPIFWGRMSWAGITPPASFSARAFRCWWASSPQPSSCSSA